MRYEIKSYNDFCFTLEVVRFGSGITGLSPIIQIKRFSTNQYWNGTAWTGTPTTFPMSQADAVNFPGLYIFDFVSGGTPIDTSVDTRYLVKVSESTQPITEYISVTTNRLDDIIGNKQGIVQNIADFFDASAGFNASSSIIGTVTDVTNVVDANVVDWNGTSPTLTKDATNDLPNVNTVNIVDANVVDWNGTSPTLTKNAISDLPEVTTAHVTSSVRADLANGILEADIWNPVVDPTTLTALPSSRDTIARAITSTYLGSVYKTPYDASTTEDIYTCTYTDGAKFYSSSLPTLSDLELLVKQDAILFKGWDGAGTPTMASWTSLKMKITGAGIDANGKYLVLEDSAGNANSYTFGADSIIITNQNTADPEEIATAVWNEPVDTHSIPGTFGLLTRIIAGLVHFNHRIKDPEYDQTGRMTGCRVVVYPSAADAEADTNSLSTIIINSTYNSGNNMSSYLATEE